MAATVAAASRMATLFALGQAAVGSVSPPVAALAQSVLQAMTVAKLKTMAALVVILASFVGGAGWAAHRMLAIADSDSASALAMPGPPRARCGATEPRQP
jgi:hypothetical protein